MKLVYMSLYKFRAMTAAEQLRHSNELVDTPRPRGEMLKMMS